MKIVHIIFTTNGYKASGAVSAAISLSKELSKSINIIILKMSDRDHIYRDEQVKIHEMRSSAGIFDKIFLPKRIKNLFVSVDFSKIIEIENPDIIHFHNPIPPFSVFKTARWCKKNNYKYVMTSHGFNEIINFSSAFQIHNIWYYFIKIFIHVPLKYVLKNASCLFLLSKNEVTDVQHYLNKVDIKYSITPNGYPSNLNSVKIKKIPKWEYLFNDDKPSVLFLGNHTRNKGIDILLKCSPDLINNCKIIIGGKTRLKNGKHYFMGKNDIVIDKNVTFTEFLSDEEKYYLLSRCDMLVHPTRADTLPLAIIEGMLFKKAVVSTNVGGIPSLIDEKTGIIIKPGNSKLLTAAINDLLINKNKRIKMGYEGRQKILNEFTWKKSAARTIKTYKELISSKT